jgi:hypothetical protein
VDRLDGYPVILSEGKGVGLVVRIVVLCLLVYMYVCVYKAPR